MNGSGTETGPPYLGIDVIRGLSVVYLLIVVTALDAVLLNGWTLVILLVRGVHTGTKGIILLCAIEIIMNLCLFTVYCVISWRHAAGGGIQSSGLDNFEELLLNVCKMEHIARNYWMLYILWLRYSAIGSLHGLRLYTYAKIKHQILICVACQVLGFLLLLIPHIIDFSATGGGKAYSIFFNIMRIFVPGFLMSIITAKYFYTFVINAQRLPATHEENICGESRITKVIIALTLAFIILEFPVGICFVVYLMTEGQGHDATVVLFVNLLMWLVALNSCVNFIVLRAFSPNFRAAVTCSSTSSRTPQIQLEPSGHHLMVDSAVVSAGELVDTTYDNPINHTEIET